MNQSNGIISELLDIVDPPFSNLAMQLQKHNKNNVQVSSISNADDFWGRLCNSNSELKSQDMSLQNSTEFMLFNTLIKSSIKLFGEQQKNYNDGDFNERIPKTQLNQFLKEMDIEVKWVEKSSSLTKASLHYLFSGVTQQKHYRYTFKLSPEILNKILKNYGEKPNNINRQFIRKLVQILQQKGNVQSHLQNFFIFGIYSNSQNRLIIDFTVTDSNITEKNISLISKYCEAEFQNVRTVKYLIFSPQDFQPQYNIKNWAGGVYLRGPYRQILKGLYQQLLNYYCPNQQYIGFGIKVFDNYKLDGIINNQWMGQDGAAQNWSVAYCAGTSNEKIKNFLNKKNIKLDTEINLNTINNRKIVGNGFLCTPQIALAYDFCSDNCKIVFHCRINPYKVNVCKSFPNIWIVNEIEDIRPYRIIMKEN